MKTFNKLRSYYREFKFLAKGLLSRDHPVLAHVIPVRRCNLSCAYCNEYDDYSSPVPLNEAGLEYLQISIDNVSPNEISKKSLKVLDKKLIWLSEMAEFKVNINSVLGGGTQEPQDALTIGYRAVELGFSSSLGIIHDEKGTLKPLSTVEREIYFKMKRIGKKGYTRLNYFQDNLVDGKPNKWRCRAGARYLYICENGLAHYCSQQRGYPGVPLEGYTLEDIRKEYRTKKACAAYCTIACVHQVATFDFWRDPQTLGVNGERWKPAQAIACLYQIEQNQLTE